MAVHLASRLGCARVHRRAYQDAQDTIVRARQQEEGKESQRAQRRLRRKLLAQQVATQWKVRDLACSRGRSSSRGRVAHNADRLCWQYVARERLARLRFARVINHVLYRTCWRAWAEYSERQRLKFRARVRAEGHLRCGAGVMLGVYTKREGGGA
jgi:hypothetical protein